MPPGTIAKANENAALGTQRRQAVETALQSAVLRQCWQEVVSCVHCFYLCVVLVLLHLLPLSSLLLPLLFLLLRLVLVFLLFSV